MSQITEDRLTIWLDRAQQHPLTMITSGKKDSTISSNQKTTVRTTKEISGYQLFTGFLQSYTLPQQVDFRINKTFSQDSYLYILGEKPPFLDLNIVFSDGLLCCEDEEGQVKYNRLDIFKMMEDKSLISTPSATNMIGFYFNRLYLRGYILGIVVGGSSSNPGTVSAGVSVVVKDYTTREATITETKSEGSNRISV